MSNSSPKGTACFKVLDRWHYYVGLMIYAFEDFIYEWMENVSDSSNLHFQRLEGSFAAIQFCTPLPVNYRSADDGGGLQLVESKVNVSIDATHEVKRLTGKLYILISNNSDQQKNLYDLLVPKSDNSSALVSHCYT